MTELSKIISALQKDKVGLYPCDTVWGLIGQVSETAGRKIARIKNRPETMGFVVLIPDLSYLEQLCSPLDPKTREIVESYWPGPITFILPKHPALSKTITGGRETIAIRYPKHEGLLSLMTALKAPLISSSANTHQEKTPKHWNEISEKIRDQVDFSYGKEIITKNRASTIVDLTQKTPKVLRDGRISFKTD